MLVIVVILLILIALKVFKTFNYWNKKGVKSVSMIYCFNNYAHGILRLHPSCEIFNWIYSKHKERRYMGFYNFVQPVLLIFDPNLIKNIMLKDFQTFPDRAQEASPDIDKVWNQAINMLPYANGWRELRATINPFFSNAKMKMMFPLIQKCSSNFVDYLNTINKKSIELNDAFLRYANDVIGCTAFGFTTNSFTNKENDIWLIGKQIALTAPLSFLSLVVCLYFPFIIKLLHLKNLPEKIVILLKSLINESIRLRKEQNIIRPDIVHFLNEARSRKLEISLKNETESKVEVPNTLEITDDVIAAQIAALTLGGINTVSSLLMFISYELAKNPEIQEKLWLEINEKIDNDITYIKLQSMTYLDNIIHECLRIHPASALLDRISVKPYLIKAESPNEQDLFLPKNTRVWIPVHAIQTDSAYFPNPEKFDPDRFDKTNNGAINPYTYMPFGIGLRKCIGENVAMTEIKLVLIDLLQNYEIISPNKSSKISCFDYKSNISVQLRRRL